MKSLLLSKTFWVNALTVGASFATSLPPKYAVPALGVANIGLRILTTGPVTIGNVIRNLRGSDSGR